MNDPKIRTGGCTSAQGRDRLRQARAMVDVAEMVLADPSEDAHPSVAAALAVLAGIAASDAACCAALKRRSRGQSHTEAVRLVATVGPGGAEMAKDLRRLVLAKDDSHYGLALVSRNKAVSLVKAAQRLISSAGAVLERYP